MATITGKSQLGSGRGVSVNSTSSTYERRVKMTHVPLSLDDSVEEGVLEVGPSADRTIIRIKSTVDFSEVRKGRSDQYLASQRRRKSNHIAMMFDKLTLSHSAPIVIATHPILHELKSLIELIQPSRKESNAREVLRQVRDTLLNGHWDKYASAACCKAASTVLLMISEVDEVSFDTTLDAADTLEANGFRITGIRFDEDEKKEIFS